MEHHILGLGLMSLESEQEMFETIKYAISILPLGDMLLLNTAQFYGKIVGDNEKILGKVLGMLTVEERDKIIVITKGGVNQFYLEEEDVNHNLSFNEIYWNDAYQNADTLRKSFVESNNNLCIDQYPNLKFGYILHRKHPNENEFYKQLDVLAELFISGKVNFIGLSEVSLNDLIKSQTYLRVKGACLHFLESEFSMNVQFLLECYLEYCQNNGITILGYSPLSRGFWCDEINIKPNDYRLVFSMWQPDNHAKLLPMLESVRKFAKDKNYHTSQVALAWIYAKNIIPIPGSSSFANNKINIDSYHFRLTGDEVKKLDNYVYDMTKKYGIKRYS